MSPQVEMFFLKGPQKDRKYNDYWKNNTNIWYRNRFRHPKTTWNSCISSLPIGRNSLNHLLYCKASFLTDLQCQFLCLGQIIRNRPSCTCGILSASVFLINQWVDRGQLNNFLFLCPWTKFDNDRVGKQDTQHSSKVIYAWRR
jgi:hypothetical protein